MEKKKETITFFDYKEGVEKTMEMPNCTKYEYLAERNKNYMNNIAISFDKRKITYEELHERIDKYARALYRKGIRKGDLIAVCAVNTPESVFLMYALDKIGAITVGLSPLNNEYQMRRDIEMIKPKMVITVDMFYGNVKGTIEDLNISPILYSPLESIKNPLVKAAYGIQQLRAGNRIIGEDHNLKQIVRKYGLAEEVSEELAEDYVSDIMFTGGSTGKHKGVELYGNGFNCLIQALDYVFFLEPGQRHLGNVPINHMVFGKALTHYVLCNNLEYALTLKMTPPDFTSEIIRTRSNGIMGGPIHFENLIDNPLIKKGSLSFVEQAVSGGEHFKAQKKQSAEAALRKGGSKAIIANAIGATETESVTHVNLIDTRHLTDLDAYPFNVDYEKNPVTCGYPIPGIKYKIVDPITFEEVEKGKTGLLWLSGPTIMKGYYNNPEENAKVFHYDEDGTRWYDQGDYVCNVGENFDEVIFAGRQKRNFVCNVTNIYPEEIEELLVTIPEIREAVITKIPDEKRQYVPIYHIRLNEECDIKQLEEKISALIIRTLGDDALPSKLKYTLEPLPKTQNGKFDATTLEQQDLEEAQNVIKLKREK